MLLQALGPCKESRRLLGQLSESKALGRLFPEALREHDLPATPQASPQAAVLGRPPPCPVPTNSEVHSALSSLTQSPEELQQLLKACLAAQHAPPPLLRLASSVTGRDTLNVLGVGPDMVKTSAVVVLDTGVPFTLLLDAIGVMSRWGAVVTVVTCTS
jgi:hypothetical protein